MLVLYPNVYRTFESDLTDVTFSTFHGLHVAECGRFSVTGMIHNVSTFFF